VLAARQTLLAGLDPDLVEIFGIEFHRR
jgi:hypothetical protein